MYWKEDDTAIDEFRVSEDIVDVVYSIRCRSIPVDHAHALSESIHTALPWFAEEADAGLHMIHISEAGNGWSRPDNPEIDELVLSRRSRLILRLPKHRLNQASELKDKELEISGRKLTIGDFNTRPLSSVSTQFSRYVQTEDVDNEEQFLNHIAAELEALLETDIRKIMCGKAHTLTTPEGRINTRSVMVADLSPESAVLLEQKGLGSGRKMGCGLFIPHKGIKAVKETH